MKPSPIQRIRLKTCLLGDFDMLKSNLTSKTFDFATQTPKLRKTTSISFFIRSPGYFLLFFIIFLIFPVQGIAGSALAKSGAVTYVYLMCSLFLLFFSLFCSWFSLSFMVVPLFFPYNFLYVCLICSYFFRCCKLFFTLFLPYVYFIFFVIFLLFIH